MLHCSLNNMPSRAALGTYYRGRTREWLEKQGYTVAQLEMLKWVLPPGRRPFAVKKDQLGSDLLAVSATEVLFVQAKLGRDNIAAGRKLFREFPCPPGAKQLIAVWERGARAPELIDCATVSPTRSQGGAGTEEEGEAGLRLDGPGDTKAHRQPRRTRGARAGKGPSVGLGGGEGSGT